MTILRALTFLLFLSPFLAAQTGAQETDAAFPEPLSDTVSDFAGALNATEEGRISRILAETRDQTGVQIAVVTADGLDSLNGKDMRLEEFGQALFNAWGIGGKKHNDGILILIDTSAHDARIALGSDYPAVYDDRAARVLATALLPKLREGRMAAGVEAGIILARDMLVLPFQKGDPIGATDGFATEEGSPFLRIGIGAVGILGFLGIVGWRRIRAKRVCPNCGAPTLKREQEIITAPNKFQLGLGLQHLSCSSCGFVDRQSYPIKFSSSTARQSRDDRFPASASDGDGKDRGFGGGKSDGGGASGKW